MLDPRNPKNSGLFAPDGKRKLSRPEIERLEKIRQERKKRNWTLDPYRY